MAKKPGMPLMTKAPIALPPAPSFGKSPMHAGNMGAVPSHSASHMPTGDSVSKGHAAYEKQACSPMNSNKC